MKITEVRTRVVQWRGKTVPLPPHFCTNPMDVVARETGFADRDRMRRAFLRAYGQPPQSLRRSLRHIEWDGDADAA